MGDKRKKDIKDTIVSFLFFAVVFGVVWSLYYFYTDYKRVADFKTKECGNLYMTDSPDPGRSMDDYVGSLEVGGYYKVTLLNVQMPDAKTVSVTRFEKVERP